MEVRIQAITDRIRQLDTIHLMLQKQESSLREEIDSLAKEDLLLEKVAELFKFLINKYVYEYAESFSRIITEGLRAIYFDQEITFDIEVDQKRGKICVNFVLEQNGVREHPLEGFGGGVSSIVSILLRLLVILKADLARYLILDESLAALSDNYVEGCGEFLRKLCKDMGVNVLLITHNQDFVDLADHAYMGIPDTENRLQLKKIR